MAAINVQLYFTPQDRFDRSNGINQVSISRALRSASKSILLPTIGDKSDSLRGGCVTIKCYSSDMNNPVLQEICVKVKDLQVALNLGKSEIRRAKKKGTLEELVYNKLPQTQLFKENKVSTSSKIPRSKDPVDNINKLTLSLRSDPVLTLLEPEHILPPESDIFIPDLINPEKIELLLQSRFADFKLTFKQFMELYRYFYQVKLDQLSQSTHFSKNALKIERSLLYIAEGVFKGPYIILKDRDKEVKDIGKGSSRVSYAMNFEGQLFAFKSTSSIKVKMMEWIVNDVLMETPENYVVGQYIEYKGRTTEKNGVKRNEKKVGVLLPLMEGGDLLDYYNSTIVEKKSVNKIIYPLAFQLADYLAVLHEKNIVHLDLKLENILLDKSRKQLKIADFGLSTFRRLLTVPVGSLGYIDPTLVYAGRSHPQFYNDIWSFGIVVSILKHGTAFETWTEQRASNFEKLKNISQSDYDAALDEFLPNRHNKNSIDWIIDKCLRLDPTKRPTAKQVVEFLRKLIQKREAISPLR